MVNYQFQGVSTSTVVITQFFLMFGVLVKTAQSLWQIQQLPFFAYFFDQTKITASKVIIKFIKTYCHIGKQAQLQQNNEAQKAADYQISGILLAFGLIETSETWVQELMATQDILGLRQSRKQYHSIMLQQEILPCETFLQLKHRIIQMQWIFLEHPLKITISKQINLFYSFKHSSQARIRHRKQVHNISGILTLIEIQQFDLMINQSENQHRVIGQINLQGSLNETYCQQTQSTGFLNAKYTGQDRFLFQVAKNLHLFRPQAIKSQEQEGYKSLNERSAMSQQDQNQQNFETKRQRSIFQNFQKHLITTLKTEISFQQNFRNDPIIHLAHRMWKIFRHTNYFSKKILHFLFGVKSDIDPKLEPNIHPNFTPISSIYPRQEIQLAQIYLREQVVRQAHKTQGANLLKKRRMQKGQEFLVYFQKFIEELQIGGISRRLPKQLKNRD